MKKRLIYISFILLLISLLSTNHINVFANELSDSINDQMQNLDLSALENVLSASSNSNFNFSQILYSILKGEYNFNYNNFFKYFLTVFLSNVNSYIPTLFIIVAIAILSSIINSIKSNFLDDGVSNVIYFVFFSTIILVVGSELFAFYDNTRKTISLLAKVNEIMSPIILTLIVASGGSITASVFKPATIFLSSGIMNLILSVILPLVALSTIFSFINNCSNGIKLTKITESINSWIKWILGLVSAIFGIFLTIQGISSAFHDGISIRATKYAISNSIPIAGSMIKDGFDLIVAGSVLIKNSIGIATIFALFYIILSPVITMLVFSLLLKLIAGITEPIGDKRISDLCFISSKAISYLISTILISGLMFFIMILLMIFSANAFI